MSPRQLQKCSSDTFKIALHLFRSARPLGCRSPYTYSSTHFSFGCWRRRRRRRWESWKWFPKCDGEGFFNPICASRVLVSNQSGGVAQGPRLWKRSAENRSITPGPNYTSLSQHRRTWLHEPLPKPHTPSSGFTVLTVIQGWQDCMSH